MTKRLTMVALAVGIVACVLVIFDQPAFVDYAMNADMLMPASFVHDLATRVDGWRGHHLARVPSLIPDLAVMAPLLLATGSARWAVPLYGVAQLSGFVAVGGWLASRLARREWLAGSAAVLAVFAALLGLALVGGGGGALVLSAVLPVIHVGPLLVSLLGAALAAEGSVLAVVGVAGLVFLSDKTLLIEFVVPLLATGAVLAWAGWRAPSRALRDAVAVCVGLAWGAAAFWALRHAGVRSDPMPSMGPRILLYSLHTLRIQLPGLVAARPVAAGLFAAAGLGLVAQGWAVTRAGPIDDKRAAFLWCFAAFAVAGGVVFTGCFYFAEENLRYLAGAWLWLVIALAAWLSRLPVRPAALAWLPAAALGIVFAVRDHGRVALLAWDSDVAACVRRLRDPLDLHAGLADYWTARPAEVALGWSTQIDQVVGDGRVTIWENDPLWYRSSLADPAVPPTYDFMVMRGLDADRVAVRYGQPSLAVPCADTSIWVWRDRAAFAARVAATLPPP